MVDTTLEALKDILRAKLEEHPQYPDVRNLLGLAHAYEGEHEKAVSEFENALQANPKYGDGLINLGFSLLEMGEVSKAQKSFRRVNLLLPDDLRPPVGLSLAHLRAGNGERALTLLRTKIREKMDSVLLHRTMAYLLASLDRMEEAEEELKASLKVAPYLKRRLNRFRVFSSKGETKQRAIRTYFEEVELNPDYGSLHRELAKILAHHREFRMARRELERGLHADGSLTEYYNAIGTTYYLRGSYKRAVAFYRKAVEIDPTYGKAHINLAFKYAERGEVEEAVRELRIALRIHPDYADLHYNLGLWHLDGNQLAEAEKEFSKALELNTDYLVARNSLAYTLYRLGEYDEALKQYRQVIDGGLMSADIYTNVGVIHFSRGECREAEENLEKALNLSPDYAELHYWLAKTHLRLGKKETAKDELRKFLALTKDERLRAEAEELLSELRST